MRAIVQKWSAVQAASGNVPAVEIGISAQQQLRLSHDPPLLSLDSVANPGLPLELDMDRHSADIEGTLLRAAASTADTQLGQ